MKFLATFYSHFGAIRFKKLCSSRQIPCRIQPVPRNLSSSCGTCVQWEGAAIPTAEINTDEVEQIVEVTANGYRKIYDAADH